MVLVCIHGVKGAELQFPMSQPFFASDRVSQDSSGLAPIVWDLGVLQQAVGPLCYYLGGVYVPYIKYVSPYSTYIHTG